MLLNKRMNANFMQETNLIYIKPWYQGRNLHKLPHYLILMDSVEADVTYDQLRYLAQSEIVPANNHGRILNLALGDYFESYHNGKYVMRPWLQNMYPRD